MVIRAGVAFNLRMGTAATANVTSCHGVTPPLMSRTVTTRQQVTGSGTVGKLTSIDATSRRFSPPGGGWGFFFCQNSPPVLGGGIFWGEKLNLDSEKR